MGRGTMLHGIRHKSSRSIRLTCLPWCYAIGILYDKTKFIFNSFNVLNVFQVFQPGMIYLLGTWYTQVEVSKRVNAFRSAMNVASAIGGLIAGGINQTIADRGGLRGWQWIFVVEGLISVVVGLAGYFMVPNYPHQVTSWISENERLITLDTQLSRDVSISTTPYNWKT